MTRGPSARRRYEIATVETECRVACELQLDPFERRARTDDKVVLDRAVDRPPHPIDAGVHVVETNAVEGRHVGQPSPWIVAGVVADAGGHAVERARRHGAAAGERDRTAVEGQ